MSRVRNRIFTEGCNTRSDAQFADNATKDFRDRRAGLPSAPTRESALRGERDEVVWSAVLGYN